MTLNGIKVDRLIVKFTINYIYIDLLDWRIENNLINNNEKIRVMSLLINHYGLPL